MNENPPSLHRGRRSNASRAPRAEGRQDLGFLVVNADRQYQVLRGLASPVRLRILRLLNRQGPKNINQIAEALGLPQSTIATNVQVLEEAELISTSLGKAAKGQQKICAARYSEIVVNLDPDDPSRDHNIVEVEMPLGLYTSSNVSAPCGFCSTDRILGVLDVPELFLDPRRVQAALIWFGRGYVEYKFPNNAKVLNRAIAALEFEMEMSSEVPGTNADWPSDISLWINERKIGTWTCPGDYGDRRGTYTPPWWKLEGSQYGILTTWRITAEGTFLGERKLSDIATTDLDLDRHHSIRLRIGIDDKEGRPGGVNIFGRGFGNHNQDIKMRLYLHGTNALPHIAT
ncbi:ArsR/SmtB family transcription factor [Bosea psychrotolerans]|uniref:ArsR family transcriptional regulator n=1 Tax=Bosea psychrotolerans TaxID=1871628 RepID=A0A2S4M000_9HYPH|nr:helix-turn-helix domain-containing protein [Bosea psychrotolerans]POR48040.1 ArsR family transcriptional regulator [Bosea psychrotolerans]